MRNGKLRVSAGETPGRGRGDPHENSSCVFPESVPRSNGDNLLDRVLKVRHFCAQKIICNRFHQKNACKFLESGQCVSGWLIWRHLGLAAQM